MDGSVQVKSSVHNQAHFRESDFTPSGCSLFEEWSPGAGAAAAGGSELTADRVAPMELAEQEVWSGLACGLVDSGAGKEVAGVQTHPLAFLDGVDWKLSADSITITQGGSSLTDDQVAALLEESGVFGIGFELSDFQPGEKRVLFEYYLASMSYDQPESKQWIEAHDAEVLQACSRGHDKEQAEMVQGLLKDQAVAGRITRDLWFGKFPALPMMEL